LIHEKDVVLRQIDRISRPITAITLAVVDAGEEKLWWIGGSDKRDYAKRQAGAGFLVFRALGSSPMQRREEGRGKREERTVICVLEHGLSVGDIEGRLT